MGQPENLLCGPLLRYTYIDYDAGVWNGTLLVVLTGDDSQPPSLSLHDAEDASPDPVCLLSEKGHTFWRFPLSARLSDTEREVKYSVSGGSLREEVKASWWVPGKDDAMRIMFYSCNGFDTEANPDDFAGVALWKDVRRIHETRPFHVMIGGGDQVYSDGVRMEGGPLKEWGDEMKPKRRAKKPCTPELEDKMDDWYFNNYSNWYSQDDLKDALARVPALNIWDDHDIIDGFGSYKDRWMRAPVFMGVGRVAWKHYLLFQLHTPPKGEEHEDPSFVIGRQTGPYIRQKSRSICTPLGRRVLFYGLDCRTERTITRVCYGETYDAMFARLEQAVKQQGEVNHLLLLLGVPIAYPRLVWAETLLSRRTVTPLRLLNRKLGFASGFFNNFDGSSELLDDLNDHWCAGTHKRERNFFIRRLQDFARTHTVRITILGGDVHLAAVGRFFSKDKLKIPANKDPRYMINAISSAITNAGPPMAVANVLDRRNKMHHFDTSTGENMMAIFTENPDGSPNRINQTTMPHRNFLIITESSGLAADNTDGSAPGDGELTEGKLAGKDAEKQAAAQDGESPAEDMGTARREKGGPGSASAAAPVSGTKRKNALDLSFRIEIDQHDPEGKTRAYGFAIPALDA